MTEHQGYRTKMAHDIAVMNAAVAELAEGWNFGDGWKNIDWIADEARIFTADERLSEGALTIAHRPTDEFTIKWRDPSPVATIDMWGQILREAEHAFRRRWMAGMEPPVDRSFVDHYPHI